MISKEVALMPDVLIRGLSVEAVRRIDAAAASFGLSRNEYLRRRLGPPAEAQTQVRVDDLRRAASATSDLLDPHVMNAAWR